MFDKLEKTTYAEQIVQRIRDLIVDQQLGPGDRLPSERELAERFGVSRPSIREALGALSALGLVEVSTGRGTYVSSNLISSIMQTLSMAIGLSKAVAHDLIEARGLIEPEIAALAAQRATDHDKQLLRDNLARMERALGDLVQVVDIDLEFHMLLAKATRNQVLLETMMGLQHLLKPLMIQHLIGLKQHKVALAHHTQLFEAVQAGDEEGAREAMLRGITKDNEAVSAGDDHAGAHEKEGRRKESKTPAPI